MTLVQSSKVPILTLKEKKKIHLKSTGTAELTHKTLKEAKHKYFTFLQQAMLDDPCSKFKNKGKRSSLNGPPDCDYS